MPTWRAAGLVPAALAGLLLPDGCGARVAEVWLIEEQAPTGSAEIPS
jgi:hypothetical protein